MRPLKIMKLLNKGASIVMSVLDRPVNIRSLSSVISEISTIDLLRNPHLLPANRRGYRNFRRSRKTLFPDLRLKATAMAFEVHNHVQGGIENEVSSMQQRKRNGLLCAFPRICLS